MGKKIRSKYTPEFKLEAVRLVECERRMRGLK
jgi:transposase-like protein